MFSTDRLLYIELHKTGCSHIRAILKELTGGIRVGKHNRPTVIPTDRTIIGSVRNPWDWYVSLWAFGCKQQGAIYGRTTTRFTPWYYRTGLMREMNQEGWQVRPVLGTLWYDARKPTAQWRELYADSHDPVLFRRWLQLLYDPSRRFDVGEGFGFSSLSGCAGLMTYRYVKLFSRDISQLYSWSGPKTFAELEVFDARENALDATIRTENLESDLLSALARAGYALTPEQVRRVNVKREEKTNPSDHLETGYYYDGHTTELVYDRERLIIHKYAYSAP